MRTDIEKDLGLLLLRMTVGGLMLFHGVDKVINGISWLPPQLSACGLRPELAYGVYIGEVIAPLLLIFGVAMRTSATMVVFTMIVAVYVVHPTELVALGEHGEYALEVHAFYVAGALAAALLGPGRFSAPVPAAVARM